MPNQKKIEKAQTLAKLLSSKKNFLIIKFTNISHQRLEQLRKNLKEKQAKLTVIKNTLFEKALESLVNINQKFKEIKEKFFPLRENSALLIFEGDWSEALSSFYKFAKNEGTLFFKFAFLDDVVYSENDLIKLSQLPSKNELLAKIIGGLKSPSSRLVYALKFSFFRLSNVISQIGKKKGGEKNGN